MASITYKLIFLLGSEKCSSEYLLVGCICLRSLMPVLFILPSYFMQNAIGQGLLNFHDGILLLRILPTYLCVPLG